MSVVGEVVGIIACVAAVVSAYHDGGHIIQKIKVRRAQKRAAPPTHLLEDAVDQAPGDIEREKQRGVQRFGKAFESGDTIAVIALQQITIKLQGSLLAELRHATFDDGFTDFRHLVDVADAGRDKTMNTLIELRQRLLVAEPIRFDLSPTSTLATVPTRSTLSSKHIPSLPEPPPLKSERLPAPQSAQANHNISRDASGEEDATSGAENTSRKKRGSSLLSFLRPHRASSHGDKSGIQTPSALAEEHSPDPPRPATPVRDGPGHAPKSPTDPRLSVSTGSGQSVQTQAPSWDYQPWEVCSISLPDDPAKIWGTPKNSPEATSPGQPSGSPPPAVPRPSVAPSFARNPSVMIPTPTPDNGYLGFCKHAVRLQNGDKGAMDKCDSHAYSRSGYALPGVFYFCCKSSKCRFMSPSFSKAEKVWDHVYREEALGLQYRWAFLAKSHVQQKQAKGEEYAYQCVFCTFMVGKGAVFHGKKVYLHHVASHRGDMSEVLKYKALCVNDQECKPDDKFDINLFPLEASEAPREREREPSEVLSDELMGYPAKPEPADSMFGANEPWNEGLSNFHYGGEDDPKELA